MAVQATERWLLPFLATIRTRPGMFLGDERVETLQTLMVGYEMGREDAGGVGMYAEDAALLARFDAWMAQRANYDRSHRSVAWPSLVKRLDDSERSVVMFFKLFEEFLHTTGQSLDNVGRWTTKGWQVSSSSVEDNSNSDH